MVLGLGITSILKHYLFLPGSYYRLPLRTPTYMDTGAGRIWFIGEFSDVILSVV